MDGNYKLSVPKGGKVTVSYIGFRDATTNGGTIKLVADDKTLQEVVVVGYMMPEEGSPDWFCSQHPNR